MTRGPGPARELEMEPDPLLLDRTTLLDLTGAGAKDPIFHSVMFRSSLFQKRFVWAAPGDIVITCVQKMPGSSGNLLVATVDISSADVAQFDDGATIAGVIIYADRQNASIGDTVAGLGCRVTVRDGQLIYLWHETTSSGAIVMYYHHTNAFQS